MSDIPAKLERLVRERSGDACEYCRLPQSPHRFRFPLDHVIAKQHGGKAVSGNLCLACPRCNLNKGPNIASIDPITRRLVRLFHPRQHNVVGAFPLGRRRPGWQDCHRPHDGALVGGESCDDNRGP